MEYQQHPLSKMFPRMTEDAFCALCDDIAAHGLLHPIVRCDDMVLDGWHRYRACQKTGASPRFMDFDGDSAAAREYVISVNQNRRHVTTSQMAMTAARFAALPHGGDRTKQERNSALALTIEEAARRFGVSKDSIKSARDVLRSGNGELIAGVEKGSISVSAAAKQLRAKTRKKTPTKHPSPISPTSKPGATFEEPVNDVDDPANAPPPLAEAVEEPPPGAESADNTVRAEGDWNHANVFGRTLLTSLRTGGHRDLDTEKHSLRGLAAPLATAGLD